MNINSVKTKDYGNERPWKAKKTNPIKPNFFKANINANSLFPTFKNQILPPFFWFYMVTNRIKNKPEQEGSVPFLPNHAKSRKTAKRLVWQVSI